MKEYGFHPEIQEFRSKQERPWTLDQLRERLQRSGCHTPILVWNDWIIDGHRRYPICMEFDIPFKVLQCDFKSVDDAKLWIYENLFTRHDKRRRRRPSKPCERSVNPVPSVYDQYLPERTGESRTMLPLGRIRVDCQTQSRLMIDKNLVKTYAEAMRRGDLFPPILLFHSPVNHDLILVDGFHRFYAHKEVRPDKKIAAVIRVGTLEEALWESYAANANHGKSRSRGDKGQAVRNALQHSFASKMSNYQIAQHLFVDEKTVRRVRKELESTTALPQSAERVGKDGRTINTGKIGKSNRDNSQSQKALQSAQEPLVYPSDPRQLVAGLLAQHHFGYVEEVVFAAMEAINQSEEHGIEATQRVISRLTEEYGK